MAGHGLYIMLQEFHIRKDARVNVLEYIVFPLRAYLEGVVYQAFSQRLDGVNALPNLKGRRYLPQSFFCVHGFPDGFKSVRKYKKNADKGETIQMLNANPILNI